MAYVMKIGGYEIQYNTPQDFEESLESFKKFHGVVMELVDKVEEDIKNTEAKHVEKIIDVLEKIEKKKGEDTSTDSMVG